MHFTRAKPHSAPSERVFKSVLHVQSRWNSCEHEARCTYRLACTCCTTCMRKAEGDILLRYNGCVCVLYVSFGNTCLPIDPSSKMYSYVCCAPRGQESVRLWCARDGVTAVYRRIMAIEMRWCECCSEVNSLAAVVVLFSDTQQARMQGGGRGLMGPGRLKKT